MRFKGWLVASFIILNLFIIIPLAYSDDPVLHIWGDDPLRQTGFANITGLYINQNQTNVNTTLCYVWNRGDRTNATGTPWGPNQGNTNVFYLWGDDTLRLFIWSMNIHNNATDSIPVVSDKDNFVFQQGLTLNQSTIVIPVILGSDDAYRTEVGGFFIDTPYIELKSTNYGLEDGLRFQKVNITKNTIIINAELSVYTDENLPVDPVGITAQIYGFDVDDLDTFDESSDFDIPTTGYNHTWDVNTVYGTSWHNVTVTNCIQEIIARYNWASGNDLGLYIESSRGTRREYTSYEYYNPARLYITYAGPFAPPLGDNPEDPDNPAPVDEYDWANDPFGRFQTKLGYLVMGLGMVFGPMMIIAWHPSKGAIMAGIVSIMMGLALLVSIQTF